MNLHKYILLIEDDQSLGATLSENLSLDGYNLLWKMDAESGLASLSQQTFDLIILDRMLPAMDGLDALKTIRETSDIPVLMISARGASQDRIEGLQELADDYLPKPFHLKEFRLRVESLLRRSRVTKESQFRLGPLLFDLQGLKIVHSDGTEEKLTQKEALLMQALRMKRGTPVSREMLVAALWKTGANSNTRTIDNIIVRLRKLIADDPLEPKYLISHRGIGYSLRMD